MSDAYQELQDLDEMQDLLAAYAHARLTPSGPVLSRMRANLLARAAATVAIDAAARRVLQPTDAGPSRWSLPQLAIPRRAFTAAGAGLLAVGMSMAVLAAPPGSPFFEARVTLQAAIFPTQIDARLASHEQHLSERLADAQTAAARGNPAAVEAALAAYAAGVDAAVADLGGRLDLLAHLREALGKHVATLNGLKDKVPEQAAIDRAIESSQKAVEKIRERAKNQGGRPKNVPAGPNNAPAR